MQELSHRCNLRQMVDRPTRGQYLLDLVMSDIDDMKIKHTPTIADHQGLLITTPIFQPDAKKLYREVWNFRQAKWSEMRTTLKDIPWTCMDDMSQMKWWISYHIPF